MLRLLLLPALLLPLLASLPAAAFPTSISTRTATDEPRTGIDEDTVLSSDDIDTLSAPNALTTDSDPTDSGWVDLEAVSQDDLPPPSPDPFSPVTTLSDVEPVPGDEDPFTPTTPLGLLLPGDAVPEPGAAALLALAGVALAALRRR